MSLNRFENFVIDNKVIGFFDEAITLKSGRKSHFYVNWREPTYDAFLLDQLSNYISDYLINSEIEFDSLYGVPEGASKVAIVSALKIAQKSSNFQKGSHVIPMGRAKPKLHGKAEDKFFIGKPKGRVVVLEDTITTGMSLLETLDKLKEAGVEVVAALALTDRMELRDNGLSVREEIQKRYDGKIAYHAMSEADKLLPASLKQSAPSPSVLNSLKTEFEKYGVKPLNLEVN